MKLEPKVVPYVYGNMPIPGGGYVTGFSFHKKVKNILYARTDIGGIYRYDFAKDCWRSLVDHVTHEDLSETFPLAIALDDEHPERLYAVCGVGGEEPRPNGWFCVSENYGETFTRYPLPCSVHGNNPGRGTGTRLVVDPNDSDVLYFASQTAGLLRTRDRGKTWEILDVCAYSYPNFETNLSFVFVAPNSSTIVVAASGGANRLSGETRGHSLYISYNGGNSFTPLWQPKVFPGSYTKLMGYVGHRYDFDGRYLYITLNHTGNNSWILWEGYSCDSGDAVAGKVIRFEYRNGDLQNPVDITPDFPDYGLCKHQIAWCGFGGISTCASKPGLLLLSTICRHAGDMVFQSPDYGETWEIKLLNLEIGNLHFRTSYMKPEYNGGGSLLHWLSDIKYDPFNENTAVFNTGTGVFMSQNLQSPNWFWTDHCCGIEETVHLNVYAPTGGKTMVLDIVGDLGGFAFTEEGVPCENSFADEKKDRYITSINADYADEHPDIMVATPRGNWTGRTKGGLVISRDGGRTLLRPELPWGLSTELDQSLETICRPNNNSGWAALAPDGKSVVWAVADGASLPAGKIVYSHDLGQHYALSVIYDRKGRSIKNITLKPFSDRLDPEIFYGFGPDSRLFVSRDGGASFREKARPKSFPVQTLSNIDAANKVEIRGVAGECGVFYLAMNKDGLWKLSYSSEQDEFTAARVTPAGNSVYCVGLGILPDAPDYIRSPKALYICGNLDGRFGFFRSYDGGESWSKLNDEAHNFGEIKSIDGDKTVPGRYFIATGTRGLIYGKEE